MNEKEQTKGSELKRVLMRPQVTVTITHETPMRGKNDWGTVNDLMRLLRDVLDEYGMKIISFDDSIEAGSKLDD